jgi:type IV pilus assembly protein PilP
MFNVNHMTRMTTIGMTAALLLWTTPSNAQSQPVPAVTPAAPGAQPVAVPPPGPPGDAMTPVMAPTSPSTPGTSDYTYNPSGRRDPFAAILKEARTDEENHSTPPLQRLSLTELNLIGIVWGGFGYSAMVQAPDGKGYTVRQGTRIGPNSGIVSSITENAIVVHERFTDVFGNKQVREYVKLLHAKEGSE